MRRSISCCLAVPVLLAAGAFAAHAAIADPVGGRAAPDRVDAIVLAQADKPAEKAAASEGKKATKKKPARRQPTKKEMDDVRKHVPAEYHHYLPKGR